MSNDKKIVRIDRGESEKEIPDFYINGALIIGSLYEFTIKFGLKTDPQKDPQEVVIIRMSPQHAKVFANMLIKNIEAYEKDIGEINIPEKVKKDLGV